MAAQEIPGLKKAVLAGAFVGALIAIMRYGVYHSIDITSFSPDTLALMSTLWIALDIFIVLAGLLCGYIVAATAPDTQSVRGMFRCALLAGTVAGLINLLAMALIYYPQSPDRWDYDVLNLGLYGVWYFGEIVMLSLAGAAIFTALIKKPRRFAFAGWLTAAGAGIVVAIVIALAFYAQSLVVETYHGLTINGSVDRLIVQFTIDTLVLILGVVAGIATAMFIWRSLASPANLVLCTALAGLIAGFFGLLADVLISLGLPGNLHLSGLSLLDLLNIAIQLIYGAILLMTMAIGGGVIHALWRGETKYLSAEPGER